MEKLTEREKIMLGITVVGVAAAKLRYQIAKAYELNKRVLNDDIVY